MIPCGCSSLKCVTRQCSLQVIGSDFHIKRADVRDPPLFFSIITSEAKKFKGLIYNGNSKIFQSYHAVAVRLVKAAR